MAYNRNTELPRILNTLRKAREKIDLGTLIRWAKHVPSYVLQDLLDPNSCLPRTIVFFERIRPR